MPIMPTHRFRDPRSQVILGPCPGCDLWTIEYNLDDLPPERIAVVVERALQEHLDTCSGLQEVVDTL